MRMLESQEESEARRAAVRSLNAARKRDLRAKIKKAKRVEEMQADTIQAEDVDMDAYTLALTDSDEELVLRHDEQIMSSASTNNTQEPIIVDEMDVTWHGVDANDSSGETGIMTAADLPMNNVGTYEETESDHDVRIDAYMPEEPLYEQSDGPVTPSIPSRNLGPIAWGFESDEDDEGLQFYERSDRSRQALLQEYAQSQTPEGRARSAQLAQEEEDRQRRREESLERASRKRLAAEIVRCLCRTVDWGCESHETEADDNHVTLSQVVQEHSELSIPNVIYNENMLDYTQTARHKQAASASRLQAIFEDITPHRNQSRKLRVMESRTCDRVATTYDVDSVMSTLPSLGVIKRNMLYHPIPDRRKRITSNIHIKKDGKLFKDIAMTEIGAIADIYGSNIYICFPDLPVGQTGFMTDEQQKRWLDRVFLKAIAKVVPGNEHVHLMTDYDAAKAALKLPSEPTGMLDKNTEYAGRMTYTLAPQYLEAIWEKINQIINEERGLRDFQHPFLFWQVINTKSNDRNCVSAGEEHEQCLKRVLRAQMAFLDRIFDMSRIDTKEFWLDIAREDCERRANINDGNAPLWLHWNICCVQKEMREVTDMFDDGRLKPSETVYVQHMMSEIGSVTYEPHHKSKVRDLGLAYRQFYATWKEMTDLKQIHPFQQDRLCDLALDKTIYGAIPSIAGGGNWAPISATEEAYKLSKSRMGYAIAAVRNTSYGIREEERVSMELVNAIMEELDERPDVVVTDSEVKLVQSAGRYCTVIPGDIYLSWISSWVNKYQLVFEIVRASDRVMTTADHTRIMTMMLLLLRHFISSGIIAKKKGLWNDQGLGLKTMLKDKKCGWLRSVIDWELLEWRDTPDATTCAGFFGYESSRFKDARRKKEVKKWLDAAIKMDGLVKLLNPAIANINTTVRDKVLECMCFLVMAQYKQAVGNALRNDLGKEKSKRYRQHRGGLTFELITQLYAGVDRGIHLSYPDRSPDRIVDILFGVWQTHSVHRSSPEYWQKKPFWILWQRALSRIRGVPRNQQHAHEKLAEMMKQYNEVWLPSTYTEFAPMTERISYEGPPSRCFARWISYDAIQSQRYHTTGREREQTEHVTGEWTRFDGDRDVAFDRMQRSGSSGIRQRTLVLRPFISDWPDHATWSLDDLEEWSSSVRIATTTPSPAVRPPNRVVFDMTDWDSELEEQDSRSDWLADQVVVRGPRDSSEDADDSDDSSYQN